MAVTTVMSQVRAALDLKKQKAYFVFGRTTPWDNEMMPPAPEEDITELEEIIGYKEASTVSLCRRLKPNETTNYPVVQYANGAWVLIPDSEAYNEKATHVYYETTVKGKELPPSVYRQVGIQLNTVPKEGVTKPNLLPEEVSDAGLLHCYENAVPLNRALEVEVTEKFVTSVLN